MKQNQFPEGSADRFTHEEDIAAVMGFSGYGETCKGKCNLHVIFLRWQCSYLMARHSKCQPIVLWWVMWLPHPHEVFGEGIEDVFLF